MTRPRLGLALLVAAGCGGSGPAAGGGAGTSGGAGGQSPQLAAAVDAFADAYAHAWCDGLAACCHFWPFHADVCVTSATAQAKDMILLDAAPTFAAPSLNAGARDTCLAEIQQIVASCPTTTFPEMPAPQCPWVFTAGASPPGGVCQSDADCAAPADQPPLCIDERCGEAMNDLPAGTPCGGVGATCASTLRCDRGTFTCGPKGMIGQSCTTDSDCLSGTICNSVCADYTSLGARCSSITECGPAAYCDPHADVCTSFTATGGACADSSTCAPTDYCAAPTKTCTARVPIGQACPYDPGGGDEPCAEDGWCSRTSGTLLKSDDTSPLVCVPKNLPTLCFTGP